MHIAIAIVNEYEYTLFFILLLKILKMVANTEIFSIQVAQKIWRPFGLRHDISSSPKTKPVAPNAHNRSSRQILVLVFCHQSKYEEIFLSHIQ